MCFIGYMETLNIRIEEKIQIIEMDYKGNTFTKALLSELLTALNNSAMDEELRAVIITGKKLFSAGGDVFGMKKAVDAGNPKGYVHQTISNATNVILSIVNHPLPVIAAINGAAAGAGLSMAMACDHRIATHTTKMVMAFGTLALTPDSGSSILFPERFGSSLTLKACSTGEIINLKRALELGAIDEVVEPEILIETALTYANSYLPSDRLTVERSKKLINKILLEKLVFQFALEEEAMNEMSTRSAFHSRLNNVIEKLQKK